MKNILKEKKASLKFILRAALVVFLLVILTSITLNAVNRWQDSTDDCIGTCRTSCNVGEVRYSSTCYRDGEERPGLVCCTGGPREEDEDIPEEYIEEIEEESEEEIEEVEEEIDEEGSDQDDETEDDETEAEEIEINLYLGEGHLIQSRRALTIGYSYGFTLNVNENEKIDRCEIIFINTDTRARITPTSTFEHMEINAPCEREFTITPQEEDLDEFSNSDVLLKVKVYGEEEGEETTIEEKDYYFFIR